MARHQQRDKRKRVLQSVLALTEIGELVDQIEKCEKA
jgi:hypothetical protein